MPDGDDDVGAPAQPPLPAALTLPTVANDIPKTLQSTPNLPSTDGAQVEGETGALPAQERAPPASVSGRETQSATVDTEAPMMSPEDLPQIDKEIGLIKSPPPPHLPARAEQSTSSRQNQGDPHDPHTSRSPTSPICIAWCPAR